MKDNIVPIHKKVTNKTYVTIAQFPASHICQNPRKNYIYIYIYIYKHNQKLSSILENQKIYVAKI